MPKVMVSLARRLWGRQKGAGFMERKSSGFLGQNDRDHEYKGDRAACPTRGVR